VCFAGIWPRNERIRGDRRFCVCPTAGLAGRPGRCPPLPREHFLADLNLSDHLTANLVGAIARIYSTNTQTWGNVLSPLPQQNSRKRDTILQGLPKSCWCIHGARGGVVAVEVRQRRKQGSGGWSNRHKERGTDPGQIEREAAGGRPPVSQWAHLPI